MRPLPISLAIRPWTRSPTTLRACSLASNSSAPSAIITPSSTTSKMSIGVWPNFSLMSKWRTRRKGGKGGKGPNGPSVYESSAVPKGKKGAALPTSAKNVPAKFLRGDQPKISPNDPARPVLAQWLTSANNPYFAKAMVNRFWHQLFGRGLVNPVDDMHEDNAATHPELLNTLTEQFKKNNFDVKYLLRAICNSETYQRTSRPTEGNGDDTVAYSHRRVRVLSPEQLFDSIVAAVGKVEPGKQPGAQAEERSGHYRSGRLRQFLPHR